MLSWLRSISATNVCKGLCVNGNLSWNLWLTQVIIMKLIVSQEIPKPCCVNYIKFIFVNYLCTIKSYLWQEGCMCLAYAYKLLSTNRFRKGRACATFVSWQDISIEIHVCAVWKMLKQWSTQRKCRESSEKTKPAQLSTWCSHLKLLEIWVSRNTILLVWTTRDWKEQLDQKIDMRHWLQR